MYVGPEMRSEYALICGRPLDMQLVSRLCHAPRAANRLGWSRISKAIGEIGEIVVQHKIPGSKNEDLVGEKKRIGEIETSRRNGNQNSGEAGGECSLWDSREGVRTLGQ
jgi:hypothetical protein